MHPFTAAMAIFHFAVKAFPRQGSQRFGRCAAYRAGIALEDPSTGLRHHAPGRRCVCGHARARWRAGMAQDPAQLGKRGNPRNAQKRAGGTRGRHCVAARTGRRATPRPGAGRRPVAGRAPRRGRPNRRPRPGQGRGRPQPPCPFVDDAPHRRAGGFWCLRRQSYDDFKAGPEELKAMRAEVAGRFNQALERAGLAARVDHRPLLAQKAEAAESFAQVVALDRPATKHEGKAVTQARRRGERLPRAQRNDRVSKPARAGPMLMPSASKRQSPSRRRRAASTWTSRPCTPKPFLTVNTPSDPAGRHRGPTP